uniref:Uncharacterized protein n=1 Tax=Triticum urartu TaxID=4572 RepID=A0A8R7PX70_TRIUA
FLSAAARSRKPPGGEQPARRHPRRPNPHLPRAHRPLLAPPPLLSPILLPHSIPCSSAVRVESLLQRAPPPLSQAFSPSATSAHGAGKLWRVVAVLGWPAGAARIRLDEVVGDLPREGDSGICARRSRARCCRSCSRTTASPTRPGRTALAWSCNGQVKSFLWDAIVLHPLPRPQKHSSPHPRRRAARTSDDREILLTMMELLNQLDGFYELSKIFGRLKVESNSELEVALVQWWLRSDPI